MSEQYRFVLPFSVKDRLGTKHEIQETIAVDGTIPIATGGRLTTTAEFAPLLREGAAAILQPALGRAGALGTEPFSGKSARAA